MKTPFNIKLSTFRHIKSQNRGKNIFELFKEKDFYRIDFSSANFRSADFKFADFKFADFRFADFESADFRSADFKFADFKFADFKFADFKFADFKFADFRSADFESANFRSANFRSADFKFADFKFADFKFADFRFADFESADFRSADFESANFDISPLLAIHRANYNMIVGINYRHKGAHYGYKKCCNGVIVKLCIPQNARRSQATSNKMRCSKAKVVRIYGAELAYSKHDQSFVYEVGKTVSVDDFNMDRMVECGAGIHYFLTYQEAKNY